MPRFFFHQHVGERLIEDLEGEDHDGADGARALLRSFRRATYGQPRSSPATTSQASRSRSWIREARWLQPCRSSPHCHQAWRASRDRRGAHRLRPPSPRRHRGRVSQHLPSRGSSCRSAPRRGRAHESIERRTASLALPRSGDHRSNGGAPVPLGPLHHARLRPVQVRAQPLQSTPSAEGLPDKRSRWPNSGPRVSDSRIACRRGPEGAAGGRMMQSPHSTRGGPAAGRPHCPGHGQFFRMLVGLRFRVPPRRGVPRYWLTRTTRSQAAMIAAARTSNAMMTPPMPQVRCHRGILPTNHTEARSEVAHRRVGVPGVDCTRCRDWTDVEQAGGLGGRARKRSLSGGVSSRAAALQPTPSISVMFRCGDSGP